MEPFDEDQGRNVARLLTGFQTCPEFGCRDLGHHHEDFRP